jgi:hypothetical protein
MSKKKTIQFEWCSKKILDKYSKRIDESIASAHNLSNNHSHIPDKIVVVTKILRDISKSLPQSASKMFFEIKTLRKIKKETG